MKSHGALNIFGTALVIGVLLLLYLGYIYGMPHYANLEANGIVKGASLRLLKGDWDSDVINAVVNQFRGLGICIGQGDVKIQWTYNRQEVDVWVTYGVFRRLFPGGTAVLVKFKPSVHSTMQDAAEKF